MGLLPLISHQTLAYEALSSKEKRQEKANSAYIKKNAKMPIKMLQGIRGKALERQKNKEEEMRKVILFLETQLHLNRAKFSMILP